MEDSSTKLISVNLLNDNKPYHCTACNYTTSKVLHFNVHKCSDLNFRHYKCETCGKSFRKVSGMKRHQLSHLGAKPYLCDLCGKSFAHAVSLKYHKFGHFHGNEKKQTNTQQNDKPRMKMFLCDFCGKFFSNALSLKVHKRKHETNEQNISKMQKKSHKNIRKRCNYLKKRHKSGRSIFKCSECPYTASGSRDVSVHLRTHTGERPFSCNICGKRFSTPSVVKRHLYIHSGLRPFRCDQCPKTFSQASSLKSHYINHTEKNPRKSKTNNEVVPISEQCKEKIFITEMIEKDNKSKIKTVSSCMQQENMTYTGCITLPRVLRIYPPRIKENDILSQKKMNKKERIIREIIPKTKRKFFCDECPFGCFSSRDLKVHKRKHSGERPFSCDICHKRFTTQSAVKRHQTVHTGIKPYTCDICEKSFTQASALKSHKIGHFDETTGQLKDNDMFKIKSHKFGDNAEESSDSFDKKLNISQNMEYCNSNTTKHKEMYTAVPTDLINQESINKTVLDTKFNETENLGIERSYLNSMKDEINRQGLDDKKCFEDLDDKGFDADHSSDNENLEMLAHKIKLEDKKVSIVNIKDEILNSNSEFVLISAKDSVTLHIEETKTTKNKMVSGKLKTVKYEKANEKLVKDKIKNIKGPFRCEECGYTASRNRDVVVHMRSHTGERPFKCDICGRRFTKQSVVKRHKLIHTGEKNYVCDVCGHRFSQLTGLTSHRLKHTGRLSLPWVCDMCGNSFSKESSLNRHRRVHTTPRPPTQFTCHICGKILAYECRLREHLFLHSDEKPFECEVCSKSFIRMSDLKYHKFVHTKEMACICDLCGKTFSTPKTLKIHSKTHSIKAPFNCDVCQKTFDSLSTLINHKSIHQGIAYDCDICQKTFSQISGLKKYKNIHEERPFACNTCCKSFKFPTHLRKHTDKTGHLGTL